MTYRNLVLSLEQSYALDLTSSLLYANGSVVERINSGVQESAGYIPKVGGGKVLVIVSERNWEEEEGQDEMYAGRNGGCRADETPTAKYVVVSADSLLHRILKRRRRTFRWMSVLRGNPVPNDDAGDEGARERRVGTIRNSNVVRGIVVDGTTSVHVTPRDESCRGLSYPPPHDNGGGGGRGGGG